MSVSMKRTLATIALYVLAAASHSECQKPSAPCPDQAPAGSTIKIVEISPPTSHVFSVGESVDLRVKVRYVLSEESGTIALVVQAADNSSVAQDNEVIARGAEELTMQAKFIVPNTKVLQVFMPLSGQGQNATSTVDSRAFKVIAAQEPPFALEESYKATFGTTKPMQSGTKLSFLAHDFKRNEVFILQKCGEPCNTAKMVRTWRKKDFDQAVGTSVVLSESGSYYFWIMQTLANGEVGPVLGVSSVFDGDKETAKFTSGTSLSVTVESPVVPK